MIAIIDYGMGNLGSVKNKLNRIGASSIVTSNIEEIKNCNKIILPGVGHFAKAVYNIKKCNLWDFLSTEVLINKKPILGICLGMQLMAKHSAEGNIEGFGWFDANVISFKVKDTLRFKVPHIGWNNVIEKKSNKLYENIAPSSEFYFVHSYYFKCNEIVDILAESTYETPFTSSIQKGNIFGVQFHPEKSHNDGEQLLRNFIEI
jgi:imidazole glycerol-phosphate synthase subunit HisH